MKNINKIAALLILSSVLFGANAFAGGSKSGGDPTVNTTSAPAPTTTDTIWTELLSGFGL